MKKYNKKELKQLSIERYDNDIHMYAKQRDGFVIGFETALNKEKEYIQSLESLYIKTKNEMKNDNSLFSSAIKHLSENKINAKINMNLIIKQF